MDISKKDMLGIYRSQGILDVGDGVQEDPRIMLRLICLSVSKDFTWMVRNKQKNSNPDSITLLIIDPHPLPYCQLLCNQCWVLDSHLICT